jgi:hypothetical protein
MPQVLRVTALEIGHPVSLVILMEADDTTWHAAWFRARTSHGAVFREAALR